MLDACALFLPVRAQVSLLGTVRVKRIYVDACSSRQTLEMIAGGQ